MLTELLFITFLLLLWPSTLSEGQYQQHERHGEEPENGITEEPLVQCGVDSLSMEIHTLHPFSGRIFVKGFSQDPMCQLLGNGSKTQLQFAVHFGHCGLRRSREINGVSVQATVVVSFHPIFITKLDRAYRLNCFYTEARKAVSQQLEVGQLTTSGTIEHHGTMPQCRYDILWQNAQGQPIRFARIGDTVFHRWSCQSEQPEFYCMRVHSCTVSDGQGGQNVEVLDRNGCGVDALLLRDLEYTGDLSAGQTASVFKFADKPTLHFNCQIELTLRDAQRGCELSKPKCLPPTRPSSGKSPPAVKHSQYEGQAPARTTPTISTTNRAASPSASPPPTPSSTSQSYPPTLSSSLPPTAVPRTTTITQKSSPSAPPVREKPLPSAQFRVQPEATTGKEELIPFTGVPVGGGQYKQTQVPPSKLATEGHTTEESGESNEEAVGEWAQQDAIYQDEVNSPIRRRTAQPRDRREKSAEKQQRIVRKVADFDLPERSLVVIELDENSLAHQPLVWRLLNSSIPSAFNCPSTLASQVPHWTIMLVLLFLLILLSALLWTNWPSRVDDGQQALIVAHNEQQQRRRRSSSSCGRDAEDHLDFGTRERHGPSLRF